MPANTFGPGDNSDPEWSHVIAGFTGRAHKAKMQNKPSVVIWGLGKPIREFNSSDDLAEGSIFLLSNLSQSSEEIFPTDSLPIIKSGGIVSAARKIWWAPTARSRVAPRTGKAA